MRLFFIRHGESVDNVAGIYAGSSDSPLTAHGALQARRLASSLAVSHAMTHVFSSPLQRAAKTAEAVCDAQNQAHGTALSAIHDAGLREKDFGSSEGLSFRLGAAKDRPSPTDAETSEVMRTRANRFLDEQLLPLLCADAGADTKLTCAVVAHGIILTILVKVLLERSSCGDVSVPLVPGQNGLLNGSGGLLPSWSNTGYLEVTVCRSLAPPELHAVPTTILPLQLRIERDNCTSHLKNLHKTRGGIGSAPFDAKQRTMDQFFGPTARAQKP